MMIGTLVKLADDFLHLEHLMVNEAHSPEAQHLCVWLKTLIHSRPELVIKVHAKMTGWI